jgi:hypothetical protein
MQVIKTATIEVAQIRAALLEPLAILYSHHAQFHPLFMDWWEEDIEVKSAPETWGPSDCLWLIP